ncbi:hypothetical protein SERLA73DRAFT_85313 [Serpula lacrymans var. lacrymans S7.3]|uniref:DUF6741 domain-containing protein n=2 Tax=Serpula lacrymans var. lacrymans TaxID=341189 RepID=F8PQG0_SERL3|nr:uncharacterized protein SERLADRAFT_413715 [Serpula lacrymans var. lacrymans S7.9]EGO01573.1 hypothetical protein SERLA73DRAFT_85313 [Serpula lacrymans var. lacrymans S7.3]EGO27231.1 hypothetical protein SERLADRAFT_413715 [Serpula lacrymans var. lacrymans S7.9]
MSYPGYTTSNLSRRQSIGYSSTPGPVTFPYSESHAGLYNDPMMPGYRDEHYPHPSYQIYGPPAASMSQHHLPLTSYDDIGLRDGYYPEDRHLNGIYPPVVQPMSIGRRSRRSSSISYSSRPNFLDNYHRSSTIVKFKRKGAFRGGITLGEAQANVRLSGNESYSFHELGVDHRGRMMMRVRWSGYTPLTYEIPIDGYDGRINLQTLARRVARAVVHFLQANAIPIHWDRVELHSLEEISHGLWQPKLMTTN